MEIEVCEKLKIKNPTDTIKRWCHNNLVMPNPDYYKKVNMGKWTGNTPQTIALYESVGEELWVPFGCIQKVWQMCMRSVPWRVHINEIRAFNYESNINLYSYQDKAVNEAIRAKNGVLVMPCGSGKTQCGLEIISRIGGRALWLTHTQDLLNQSKQRALSVLGNVGVGTITGGKVTLGKGITFATVQTLCKVDLTQYKDYWDIIIVDECMPGETLIDTPNGKKELKNLCVDDIITSYNRNERKVENKRVAHIFKSKAHDIVKVTLSNGEKIICTKNHPIYTRSGQWIDAERLVHDDYVLRLVREGSGNRHDAENIKAQSIGARLLLLLKGMFCQRWSQEGCLDRESQTKSIRNNEKNKQSVSQSVCGANENRQSDEKAGSAKGCIRQAKRDRAQAKDKMWKRSRANRATADVDDSTGGKSRGLRRISDTNKNAKRQRLSNLLQSGHSNPGGNGCNRGRWRFALCDRTAKTGRKKRPILEWVRVESVEIQESTSDGTFGGLCSDGYVYNIEVEDNNNYFANGILVHNCQHCAGSPTKVTQFYKVMSNLCARYKIGLTATPHRADGLELSMFTLLGGIIHEVTKEEVAHTTCPVRVKQINTGWMPEFDKILKCDGTIDYHKIVQEMTQDQERFEFVYNELASIPRGKSIIVLANRVEYLQRLCDEYNHNQIGNAICLSGIGQNKKARAERKQALNALNSGELDCIFATYQLAKEGLDVPNLRYVIFATPEKDSTTVIQSAGRVGRKFDGKEYGTVIDFVDDFSMYKGWAKKRVGYYKKIDAKIC